MPVRSLVASYALLACDTPAQAARLYQKTSLLCLNCINASLKNYILTRHRFWVRTVCIACASYDKRSSPNLHLLVYHI